MLRSSHFLRVLPADAGLIPSPETQRASSNSVLPAYAGLIPNSWTSSSIELVVLPAYAGLILVWVLAKNVTVVVLPAYAGLIFIVKNNPRASCLLLVLQFEHKQKDKTQVKDPTNE